MTKISVDDFGISELANEHILFLVRNKRVDRVSIMVYGKIVPDEVEALLMSGVKLDIHLDMESGVLQERKLKEGIIVRVVSFLWRFVMGRYSVGKIASLWEDQINVFQKIFGRLPDGLNSHQHIHFFPPFFRIFTALAEKYSIPYIRMGRLTSGYCVGIAIILDILRFFNRREIKKLSYKTSMFLVSADWIRGLNRESLQKEFDSDEFIELIFHPEREEEYQYLSSCSIFRAEGNSRHSDRKA